MNIAKSLDEAKTLDYIQNYLNLEIFQNHNYYFDAGGYIVLKVRHPFNNFTFHCEKDKKWWSDAYFKVFTTEEVLDIFTQPIVDKILFNLDLFTS